MILENFVETRWSSKTKSYYENLGYKYTNTRDFMMVKISDLWRGSAVKVTAICDKCKSKRTVKFENYKPLCHRCSILKKYDNPEYLEKAKQHMSKIFNTHKDKIISSIKEARRKMVGEKHPNWNPNITDSERLVQRNTLENKIWKFEVKNRDNFVCRVCFDKSSGKLVSHHLMGYSYYPELRYDISNGVCLCRKCHNQFHKLYGRKNNNTIQFVEFLYAKSSGLC